MRRCASRELRVGGRDAASREGRVHERFPTERPRIAAEIGSEAFCVTGPSLYQPMGFFNELGRQVESFKRTAEEVAETDTVYECRACEEQFVSEHEECLDCGGELTAVSS